MLAAASVHAPAASVHATPLAHVYDAAVCWRRGMSLGRFRSSQDRGTLEPIRQECSWLVHAPPPEVLTLTLTPSPCSLV